MAKILIVDDDEGFLLLVREYLNANNYEIDLASSAVQARTSLERSKYDVVISDFNMPMETGLDLLRYIKVQFPGLPFILVTGNQSLRLKREALRMGGSAYLEKPFQFRDLAETLKVVLRDSAANIAKEYVPERNLESRVPKKGRRQRQCA